MKLFKRAWVAVRETDGKEWFDIDTFASTRQAASDAAEKSGIKIPGWAEVNPVVRISWVRIEEIVEP